MNNPADSIHIQSNGMASETFKKMKAAYLKQPHITYEQRRKTLQIIEQIMLEYDSQICEAISKDFGNRSFHESRILEIAQIILGVRYTLKRLKKWMKPQKRHVSLMFFGAKNRVIPQAKGIVGIVSPWNYPLMLALGPLTSAIAAGNRVMVKMASNSQNLCQLLHKIFSERISEDIITILPGVSANEFSSQPYDHLLFTGSPAVGHTIMESAAKHLTPVTLELGGKSPTILGEDFNTQTAANRIMYSKLVNSGQMCVAPDYMFIPESKVDSFIKACQKTVAERYPEIQTKDYTCIIDNKAFDRLRETLADAESKKADIVRLLPGEDFDEANRKISPMIIKNITEEMRIMQEEIFGPFLPLITYQNIDEVIDYINRHERPLALYIYSNNRRFQQKILQNTISGGVSINDCAMHVAQHDMPFGGVGNSGMGSYHGFEGFVEMSKMKPVFKQFSVAVAIAPPYGKTFDTIYSSIRKLKFFS